MSRAILAKLRAKAKREKGRALTKGEEHADSVDLWLTVKGVACCIKVPRARYDFAAIKKLWDKHK